MHSKRTSRWFRFSLRTMFALITLSCMASGWVAYQLNWIWQRHELLSKIWFYPSESKEICYTVIKPVYAVRAPFPLWMFGEQGEARLYLDAKYSAADAQRAESLFPEAKVTHIVYEISRPYIPSQGDVR